MIFTYPALISENIEEKYYAGLIKTMELYFLHHLAEAVSSGTIKFYTTTDRITGKRTPVRMECADKGFVNLQYITEASDVDQDIKNARADVMKFGSDYTIIKKRMDDVEGKIKDITQNYEQQPPPETDPKYHKYTILVSTFEKLGTAVDSAFQKWSDSKSQLNALLAIKAGEKPEKTYDDIEKEYEERNAAIEKSASAKKKEKREEEKYNYDKWKQDHPLIGATKVNIDTQTTMDLRPTAITVEVNVAMKERKGMARVLPGTGELKTTEQVSMPLSVKIIPMVIKNFHNIYQSLLEDMYSNKFSAIYKGALRGLISTIASKFTPIYRKFFNMFVPEEEIHLWRDMILTKKGNVDASSFFNKSAPKYQYFASALLLMSGSDIRFREQNLFSNPKQLNQLFNTGWNSFGVMDDANQKLIFCPYFEHGLCNSIPYSYLFHSLKAGDLYKELDQLRQFTKKTVAGFGRTNMRRLGEKLEVDEEVRSRINFLFNEFLDVTNNELNKTAPRK